uniref:SXP/RAL-2 family protein Ani s 5-like cation-binding domain-containing protein n=1 Tax=Panagrellus redivivus TaxID=6233 RepID=A0A7E4W768_PANRE
MNRFFQIIICVALAVSTVAEEEKVEIQEQLDPFMAQRMQYPYGNNLNGNVGGNVVNFDFQCKCTAKQAGATVNTNTPTDPNAAAQQQIQQLNEQIRRLQEQLRRQQQGASAFEQFAQMLSMADGLDCNCSGSNSNGNSNAALANLYQQSNGQAQSAVYGPLMTQARFSPGLSGLPFQQRMAPAMIPQLQGPMFPMKA